MTFSPTARKVAKWTANNPHARIARVALIGQFEAYFQAVSKGPLRPEPVPPPGARNGSNPALVGARGGRGCRNRLNLAFEVGLRGRDSVTRGRTMRRSQDRRGLESPSRHAAASECLCLRLHLLVPGLYRPPYPSTANTSSPCPAIITYAALRSPHFHDSSGRFSYYGLDPYPEKTPYFWRCSCSSRLV